MAESTSKLHSKSAALGAAARGWPAWPSVPVALLCVYVVAWFLQVGMRADVLRALRFELIIGAALLALSVVPLRSRAAAQGQLPLALVKAAVLLILAEAVQVPLSGNVAYSWNVFLERGIKFALMAVFIGTFVRKPDDLRWLLTAFIFACGYILQESFRSALDGSMIWENQGVPRLHGSTKLFRHPNSLSGLALGVIPFLYFLWPCLRSRLLRAAFVGIGIAALAVVLYTGSRTGYVGFAFMLLVFVLMSRARAKMLLIVPVALAVAWTAIPAVYKARLLTMFTGEELEGNSMGARTQLARDAIAIFFDHPLGIGVGMFPFVRQEKFGSGQDTHNLYLEVGTNLGIQGLIAFLVFVVLLLLTLQRVRRVALGQVAALSGTDAKQAPEPTGAAAGSAFTVHDWRLIAATASATWLYVANRLVLGLFGHDLYEIYWWVALGIAVCLGRIVSSAGLPQARAPARRAVRVASVANAATARRLKTSRRIAGS